MSVPGGTTPLQQPDNETQTITNQLKNEILQQAGVEANVFELVGYKSQVVAGTNFFLKIKISDDQAIHARVFRPLPHTGEGPSVAGVKVVGLNEELNYF